MPASRRTSRRRLAALALLPLAACSDALSPRGSIARPPAPRPVMRIDSLGLPARLYRDDTLVLRVHTACPRGSVNLVTHAASSDLEVLVYPSEDSLPIEGCPPVVLRLPPGQLSPAGPRRRLRILAWQPNGSRRSYVVAVSSDPRPAPGDSAPARTPRARVPAPADSASGPGTATPPAPRTRRPPD